VTAWTSEELERIGPLQEVEIATRRRDGTLRRPVPVWIVRVGDDLYVRSWHGTDGAWYRAARARLEGRMSAGDDELDINFVEPEDDVEDAIDAVYRSKYGHSSRYAEEMVAPLARATTLKLVPNDRR
jgi:hypothetical protein